MMSEEEKEFNTKQYQMQFNNTPLELPGIASNLQVGTSGGLRVEVSDIAINSLDNILFKPFKIISDIVR